MLFFDYFKRKKEMKALTEEYSQLDDGQLKIALGEMYERLMFVGKSIKDQDDVIYDLSNRAAKKDTYNVDEFAKKVEALLTVVKKRLSTSVVDSKGQVKPVKKAEYLDFKGANPKLEQMERSLLSYGKAFSVDKMDMYEKWRDNKPYIEGKGLLIQPFSQHSMRYHNSVAKKGDLMVSSPKEIKRSVMSQEEIKKAKKEMQDMEYLGGHFVNVKAHASAISHKLVAATNTCLEEAEKRGYKREDSIEILKILAKSKDFQALGDDYTKKCDYVSERFPAFKKAIGSYHMGNFVQVANTVCEHKTYADAITEFLKVPDNFNRDNRKATQERLATYIRKQEYGTLYINRESGHLLGKMGKASVNGAQLSSQKTSLKKRQTLTTISPRTQGSVR